MHREPLHSTSQRHGPAVLECFGGHLLKRIPPGVLRYKGRHQLLSAVPLSAPAAAWSGHIQACGMQPTKGLKALKCSFSERPAFLKCQRSWKRQLAPLPAARAKQPGLNIAERCLCSPNNLGVQDNAHAGSSVSPPS